MLMISAAEEEKAWTKSCVNISFLFTIFYIIWVSEYVSRIYLYFLKEDGRRELPQTVMYTKKNKKKRTNQNERLVCDVCSLTQIRWHNTSAQWRNQEWAHLKEKGASWAGISNEITSRINRERKEEKVWLFFLDSTRTSLDCSPIVMEVKKKNKRHRHTKRQLDQKRIKKNYRLETKDVLKCYVSFVYDFLVSLATKNHVIRSKWLKRK